MSLLFFSLPYFVFFWGWTHWYFALLLNFVLFWTLFGLFKRDQFIDQTPLGEITVGELTGIFLIINLWVYWAGIGHFSFQNGDYVKHNAILHDLVYHDWPVSYSVSEITGKSFYLVYYIAYYLMAALLGKTTSSLYLANYYLYLQAVVGLSLIFLWMRFRFKKINIKIILLFLCFSGLDFLGHLFSKGMMPKGGEHIEWWARNWQFSGMTTLLFWVPQHTLPGWGLTALLVFGKKSYRVGFFISVLAILWSPFVALSLLFLSLFLAIKHHWREQISFANLIAPALLGAVLCLFLMAKLPDLYMTRVLTLERIKFWMPEFILFVLFEIGLYLIVFVDKLKNYEGKKIIYFSLLSLLALMVYRYGMYNDLAMRSSIPFLFILALFFIESVINEKYNWRVVMFLFLWSFGSLTAIQEITRIYMYGPPAKIQSTNVLQMRAGFVRQYLARPQSLFFTYLARPTQSPLVLVHPETLRLLKRLF